MWQVVGEKSGLRPTKSRDSWTLTRLELPGEVLPGVWTKGPWRSFLQLLGQMGTLEAEITKKGEKEDRCSTEWLPAREQLSWESLRLTQQ